MTKQGRAPVTQAAISDTSVGAQLDRTGPLGSCPGSSHVALRKQEFPASKSDRICLHENTVLRHSRKTVKSSTQIGATDDKIKAREYLKSISRKDRRCFPASFHANSPLQRRIIRMQMKTSSGQHPLPGASGRAYSPARVTKQGGCVIRRERPWSSPLSRPSPDSSYTAS